MAAESLLVLTKSAALINLITEADLVKLLALYASPTLKVKQTVAESLL